MNGYCKWCDTIIPDADVIEALDNSHRVVWSGCLSCHNKRNEALKHATVKRNN